MNLKATALAIYLFGASPMIAFAENQGINLRNATLPKDAFTQLEKLRVPANSEHAQIGSPDRLIYLTRPSSTKVVAVFSASDGGRHWCLNPYNNFVNYGDIPSLSIMTSSQIEQLWDFDEAHAQSKNSSRTYKLSAVNNWKDRDVFIDVVVNDDHIVKYRVRGWMITKNDSWRAIKKEGEGQGSSPENASSSHPMG
jgi:hypothetical protein